MISTFLGVLNVYGCFLGHLHLQAELEREPSLIQQKSIAAAATAGVAYQQSDDQHGKSKLFCADAISTQKRSTTLIEYFSQCTLSLREGVQIKKTFLNGHCPFRGGGSTPARLFWSFFLLGNST